MKKIFSLLCAIALVMGATAAPLKGALSNNLPAKAMAMPELQKKVELRQNNQFIHRAPQTAMDMTLNAAFVEAPFYGSYTGDVSDWVFYFVGNANDLLIYADVYDKGDATHIDGTYSFDDGSIAEALVVRAAGDTIEITGGSITVLHNTATNYHFTVALTAGNETFTLSQDLDVDAYDFLYYYMGYDSDIYLEDAGENPGGNSQYDYSFEPETPTTVSFAATSYELADYTERYGEVLLELIGADYNLIVEMFLPALDANGNIPAGTYQVSDSQADNTVLASPGGDAQYDYGTFVMADFNAQGQYGAAYYVISGSMTISYTGSNMNLNFTGTSYYGSTINVTYNGATALENVEATTASKRLVNGQLIIEKDGVRYNALGTVIK